MHTLFDPPEELSPDDMRALLRITQRLLQAGTHTAFGQELAQAAFRDGRHMAVQVWMRSAEVAVETAGTSRGTDELVLLHQAFAATAGRALPQRMKVFDSLCGFVATEGVPYRWKSSDPETRDWEDCAWAQSANFSRGFSVPLKANSRPVGAMTIFWSETLDPGITEPMLEQIAESGSLVVAQLRRLLSTRRQIQWLTALQHLTGIIASQQTLSDLYRGMFEQISQILPLDRFYISLYDADLRTVQHALIAEASAEGEYRYLPSEPAVSIAGTIWERVVGTCEPILVNLMPRNQRGEPRMMRSATPRPTARRDTVSLMYAPMMVGPRVIGIMAAHSFSPMSYDEDTLDVLSSIANQAALAIDNARLLERLTLQITETEKANRLKSQFVANISHEVRTPLNSILGFTRIVKRQGAQVLPPQQVQNLEYVLQSAQHLQRLIDELLDLSRLEAGRLMLAADDVDLKGLVTQVIQEVQPTISESQCRVSTELPEEAVVVVTDPTRVRQILINLLSNASKFARGGHISVSAGLHHDSTTMTDDWQVILDRSAYPVVTKLSAGTTGFVAGAPGGNVGAVVGAVPVSAPRTGSGLIGGATPIPVAMRNAPAGSGTRPRRFFVEVADDGKGMSQASVKELFQEFRQEESGDARAQGGVGLGLAIVLRLADLMRGAIWVRTNPGQGSCFRVILSELLEDSRRGIASVEDR